MANIPTGGHNDWLFGLLSWIPRSKTAIAGPPPTNVSYSSNFLRGIRNPDVPNEGAWALSIHPEYGFSFAYVKDGWLVAVGTFRFDYNGGYYTFPRFTIKRVK